MIVVLKSPIVVYLLIWLSKGIGGALISLNEPAVRVITIGPDDPAPQILFDLMVTITEDDGSTALAPASSVEFNLIAEFDASLVFPRTDGPDLSSRINLLPDIALTTADVVDYSTPVLLLENDAAFFLNSFKILISLRADPASPTPTTVVGRSSLELWVYNTVAYPPNFLIMNPVSVRPKSGKDVHLFAIGRSDLSSGGFGPPGTDIPVELTVSKNDSGVLTGGRSLRLPSAFEPQTPVDQGIYWKLHGARRSRRADDRFGQYVLDSFYNFLGGLHAPSIFLNPASRHLDTGGRDMFTVYRRSTHSDILDEPLTIGVGRTGLSGSIRWFKDGVPLARGRPKITIRRADQAGLYTIKRKNRKRRSWFVQILVTLSDCLRSELGFVGDCAPEGLLGVYGSLCLNGGVTGQIFTLCQCPPCFRGAFCEHLAPTGDPFAIAESRDFTCGDLPGGNKKCKGYRFCLGGNYGCTCGCGWHGRDCDKPCRGERYGPDCSQKCNCLGTPCDRFTGVCMSAGCPTGYHGFNCQLPISVPLGSPDQEPDEFALFFGGP